MKYFAIALLLLLPYYSYSQFFEQPCVIHFDEMTAANNKFSIQIVIRLAKSEIELWQEMGAKNIGFDYYLNETPREIYFHAFKKEDKGRHDGTFVITEETISDWYHFCNETIFPWSDKEKCGIDVKINQLHFTCKNEDNTKSSFCLSDKVEFEWTNLPSSVSLIKKGNSKVIAKLAKNQTSCKVVSSDFITSTDCYPLNPNYVVMQLKSDSITNSKDGSTVVLIFNTVMPYYYYDNTKLNGKIEIVDDVLYLPELSSSQKIIMSNLVQGSFDEIDNNRRTYDLGTCYGYYELTVQEFLKCSSVYPMIHPNIEYNYINNSDKCFWYSGETRKYSNGALNLNLYTYDKSKIGNFSYENLRISPSVEFLSKSSIPIDYQLDGGKYGRANYTQLKYSLTTSDTLKLIRIESEVPNFIPVKKSVKLKSYPKIDTANVSISPITCYYDTVKIEKVDVKGGLEDGKYKYILSEGDKKKEFDELPITFSKEDFGLGEHTFSLTVEDAQEPEGDTGHEERKSTQSGIKFSFPDELKILKTDIDSLLCHNDNTGRIEITDYIPKREDVGFYVLSNKDTISKAFVTEGLAAKEYNLVIHDNKGCKNDSLFVNVNQPDTLDIENLVVKNPKCFGYSDGYINYDITGGTGEKSFVWNDGFTEKDREEIPVGDYSVSITDRNKCKITKQMTLTQPEKLNNYFTGDYKICTGSSLTIDSKKYDSTDVFKEFLWMDKNSNIYSQEQILKFDSSNCGKYILISFDEKKYDNARKDGSEIQCYTTDTLNISMSSERFDKSFLVASQSYFGDTIELVNDTKNDDFDFKFEIPEELEEIGIQDKFYDYIVASKPGIYNLIMSIKGDDCTANEYREIEILNEIRPEDYDEQFVKTVQIVSMKMGPNPNDGNFTFDLVMTEKSDVSLSLYSISRPRLLRKDELKDNNKYSKEYNENLPVGEYMLLVRTENENNVIKFIVGK